MIATLQLPCRRPLVSIEMARTALDKSEDEVLALIQCGALRFAFNLAAPKSRRALVRILSLSLLDAVNATSSQPSSLGDALRYIMPGSSETVRASTLARATNTSSTHIGGLIQQRCLQKVRPGTFAKDSPLISRASAVKFLTLRRIS